MRETKHIYSYSVWEENRNIWRWQVFRNNVPIGIDSLMPENSEIKAITQAQADINVFIHNDKVDDRRYNAPQIVYPDPTGAGS